jgi:hypothetical protein
MFINIGCDEKAIKNQLDDQLNAEVDTDDKNTYTGDKVNLDEVLPLENAFNDSVLKVLTISDQALIVGGRFTGHAKNESCKYIGIVSSDGVVSKESNFHTNGPIFEFHKLEDGSILVGGDFTVFNNKNIAGLVKLDNSGKLDLEFNKNLGSGFDGAVTSIAHTNNQILVAGDFTRLNGDDQVRFVRLGVNGLPVDLESESYNDVDPDNENTEVEVPNLAENESNEEGDRDVASENENGDKNQAVVDQKAADEGRDPAGKRKGHKNKSNKKDKGHIDQDKDH